MAHFGSWHWLNICTSWRYFRYFRYRKGICCKLGFEVTYAYACINKEITTYILYIYISLVDMYVYIYIYIYLFRNYLQIAGPPPPPKSPTELGVALGDVLMPRRRSCRTTWRPTVPVEPRTSTEVFFTGTDSCRSGTSRGPAELSQSTSRSRG